MRSQAGIIFTLLLVVPVVAAGVPFELTLDDTADDVLGRDGRPVSSPSVDILRFESYIENGSIIQRIEMAARPVAPDDGILVRNWYANSTNGSFHVIDMEVRGNAADPTKRFLPLRREGDFYNATYLDAKWGVEGNAWVFSFDASLIQDAVCFDPGVFAEHHPPIRSREPEGFDDAYRRDARPCLTSPEPAPSVPRVPVVGVAGSPHVDVPTADAPGTRTPTPGTGILLLLGTLVVIAAFRTRRSP